MKPAVRILTVGLIVLCAICGGGFAWLHSMTTYYVEAYKSETEVLNGDTEALKSRFTPIRFQRAILNLEWFTYDNEEINRAPYKLFVVLETKNPARTRVEIDSIEIVSSLNNRYTISDGFPKVIEIPEGKEREAHTFEPGFDFRFHEGEKIWTKIKVRVYSGREVEEKTIELQWLPVRVKHWASIVLLKEDLQTGISVV